VLYLSTETERISKRKLKEKQKKSRIMQINIWAGTRDKSLDALKGFVLARSRWKVAFQLIPSHQIPSPFPPLSPI